MIHTKQSLYKPDAQLWEDCKQTHNTTRRWYYHSTTNNPNGGWFETVSNESLTKC